MTFPAFMSEPPMTLVEWAAANLARDIRWATRSLDSKRVRTTVVELLERHSENFVELLSERDKCEPSDISAYGRAFNEGFIVLGRTLIHQSANKTGLVPHARGNGSYKLPDNIQKLVDELPTGNNHATVGDGPATDTFIKVCLLLGANDFCGIQGDRTAGELPKALLDIQSYARAELSIIAADFVRQLNEDTTMGRRPLRRNPVLNTWKAYVNALELQNPMVLSDGSSVAVSYEKSTWRYSKSLDGRAHEVADAPIEMLQVDLDM